MKNYKMAENQVAGMAGTSTVVTETSSHNEVRKLYFLFNKSLYRIGMYNITNF